MSQDLSENAVADESGQACVDFARETASKPVLFWQEQDGLLRALWRDNKTPEEIALELGRSVAAIMTRAARLGLPRRAAPGRKRGYKRTDAPRRVKSASLQLHAKTAKANSAREEYVDAAPVVEVSSRVCLMCLKKFQSQGRHNRICPSCKGSAEYVTGSATPDFAFQVGK